MLFGQLNPARRPPLVRAKARSGEAKEHCRRNQGFGHDQILDFGFVWSLELGNWSFAIERSQMFLEKSFEVPPMQMLLFYELQPHHVVSRTRIIQISVRPQLHHPPEPKPTLGANQVQQ